MKKIIILIIMISLDQFTFAQKKKTTDQKEDTPRLETSLVKKIINKQFGDLINPKSNNIIGNFASLDLKEAEANFAGNIVFNNGSLLGIKAKGAVTDGLLSIFSNDKLNTKLGMDLQYNFLDFRDKAIIYNESIRAKYEESERKIKHDYELKKIEIKNGQKSTLLAIEIQNITNNIAAMYTKLAVVSGFQKDSLCIETRKLEEELAFKKDQLQYLPSVDASLNELENQKADDIINAQSKIKLYGFKLGWFSIGYGITNNVFRLFNGTLSPDRQISKENYASHAFRLQYSYYYKTPAAFESYFLSFGSTASIQDNFYDLAKIEINETKNYGLNPNDRTVTNKYNAYQGIYEKGLKSLSLYGDFYYFLFDNNKGALHFYPEYKMVKTLRPYTNLGFGFLIAFKNQENTDNIINAEFYANLLDVFNRSNSTEKLSSRSDYGIRFTFPINFNTKP